MSIKKDSDQNLIQQIRQSSHTAFRELFQRYYQILLATAINLLTDVNLAKDVVQDVFLQLWKKRESLNIQSSVKAYLQRAVINKALNQIKARKRITDEKPLVTMEASFHSAHDNLNAQDLNKAIEKALDTLPERCRLIFVLRRMEGYSHKEIAEMLDISTKTIENQITKALKVLKEAVKPFVE